MKINLFQSVFLLAAFNFSACSELEEKKLPVPEVKTLSIAHDVNECPMLTGKYTTEYTQDGETQELVLNLKLEATAEQGLVFNENKTIYKVDGQTHKSGSAISEYQAGCQNGRLQIQYSAAASPLLQKVFILQDDKLFINSKSLNEKVIQMEEVGSEWTKSR